MKQSFIRAFTVALIPKGHLLELDDANKAYESVEAFVSAQWKQRNIYEFLGLKFFKILFQINSLLRYGKLFNNLDLTQRIAFIHSWENSSIQFCRSFIQFHLNLILFAYYDNFSVEQIFKNEK